MWSRLPGSSKGSGFLLHRSRGRDSCSCPRRQPRIAVRRPTARAQLCEGVAAGPWQRSTRYPVTPTLSVDAVQLRSIWLPLIAVAPRLSAARRLRVGCWRRCACRVRILAQIARRIGRADAIAIAVPCRQGRVAVCADGAVPTCAKLLQPVPWQRSTRYPVTPTLSVDAVQLRLIWLPLTAVAVRVPGVLGGCVSGPTGGVRNATICITHAPDGLTDAVAL